jgi:hypothetical protein
MIVGIAHLKRRFLPHLPADGRKTARADGSGQQRRDIEEQCPMFL